MAFYVKLAVFTSDKSSFWSDCGAAPQTWQVTVGWDLGVLCGHLCGFFPLSGATWDLRVRTWAYATCQGSFPQTLPGLLSKITPNRGSETSPFPVSVLTFSCFPFCGVSTDILCFPAMERLRGHCLLWEHMNCSGTQVDHFKSLEVNSSPMPKISRKYLEFPGLVCVLWWEPGCGSWTSQSLDTRVWLGMWGNLRSAWEMGDSYLFL